MKILIDECIPRKLKRNLCGHDCLTVPEAGLAGTKNGQLLLLAQERGFEVFLTIDRGFEFEQNFSGMPIAVMIVRAKSNRTRDLLPHVPACLAALGSIKPGELVRIGY
jgi:predicted nuclease of predicted toxin-antitoxin system